MPLLVPALAPGATTDVDPEKSKNERDCLQMVAVHPTLTSRFLLKDVPRCRPNFADENNQPMLMHITVRGFRRYLLKPLWETASAFGL